MAEGARKRKILVVDDEEDFQDIVRQILEPRGFNLCSAFDGGEAIEAAARERPDLILLDVNLPVQNGYEVAKELRASKELGDIPILMITIRKQDQEVIRGLDAGADDYLPKPFDPRELIGRIQRLLAGG